MVLIDIHSTDFFNADFDSQDLINLQILYLSYPSLFRRIYNSETYGGKEVYSVKLQAGRYENSERFKEILKDENYSDNEKFLLNMIVEDRVEPFGWSPLTVSLPKRTVFRLDGHALLESTTLSVSSATTAYRLY